MVDRQPPRPLVILDRDGVINRDSDAYIRSPDDWLPIPGSMEAIARLTHAGYRIAIATNQSGLGRNLFSYAELNAIHQRLYATVATYGGRIDLIAFCPHTPDDGCDCRKPRPGLLRQIAERLRADLAAVPFIGDSLSDLAAARAVGAQPYLVRTGKGPRALRAATEDSDAAKLLQGVPVYDDLAAAVEALLENTEAKP